RDALAGPQQDRRLVECPLLRLARPLAIAQPRDLRERQLRDLSAAQLQVDRLLLELPAKDLAIDRDDELPRPRLADVDQADDLARRQFHRPSEGRQLV